MHDPLFVVVWYLPLGQAVHDDLLASENLPFEHALHSNWLSRLLYLPAGQFVHGKPAVRVHGPAVWKRPFGQPMQALQLVLPIWFCHLPCGHVLHCVCFTASWYLPAGQPLHCALSAASW